MKLYSNESFNLSSDKPLIQMLLAYLVLGGILTAMLAFGSNLFFYLVFALAAALFILPASDYFGLGLIMALTMIFEKFFTLQPLIMGENIYKLYPLDIVMVLTLIAFILRLKFGRERPKIIFGTPEKVLLFFLIGVALYLVRSLVDINAQLEVAFSSFKNYFFYPLIYFLVIYSVQNKDKFKNFIHLLLLIGLFIIGFIAFGLINGSGLWTEYTPLSTAGTRLLASTHAFYLTLAVILALPLLIYKRFQTGYIANLIILIWLFGIVGSLMRHLWLALAFGLVIIFTILPKNKKKSLWNYGVKNGLIILTAVAVMILAVQLFPYYNSIASIKDNTNSLMDRAVSFIQLNIDTSALWRLEVWRSGYKLWLTNPLWGIGFGKQTLMDYNGWLTFEEIRNFHNSSLVILVQMGLAGLIVFLAFIGSVVIKSWRAIFKDEELIPYYLGLVTCIFVFLFASFFQPYLEANFTGIFLWLILGLTRTAGIINEGEKS